MGRDVGEHVETLQRGLALREPGERMHRIVAPIESREAEHRAKRRADNTDEQSLVTVARRHTARIAAERREQPDLARLAHHRDQQRAGDGERGDDDDEGEQEEDHVLLQLEHEEEVLVDLDPRAGAGTAAQGKGIVDARGHLVGVDARLGADVDAMHAGAESVEILHQAERADDQAAIELVVPDLEDARHA